MANFHFICIRRNRIVSFLTSALWLSFIFMTTLFFVITMVCYDGDDDETEVIGIENRLVFEDKQGVQSREEELLKLAAQLEKELFEHQERITLRLETLRTRNGIDGGRRELESSRHHRHHQGTEHRLKRRLMDAPSSHGLGGDGDGGGGGDGGGSDDHSPFVVGQSGSSSVNETKTRDDQSIPGVKASQTNKTVGILGNTLENGSLTKTKGDVNPPRAKSTPEKSHNANKLGSFNMEINTHQSITMRTNIKPQNDFQNINDQPHDGSFKHFNPRQNVLNYQSREAFINGERPSLPVSGVVSTPLHPSSAQAEAQLGGETAAVMISNEPLLGCEDLVHVNSREQVGSGYTKRVEKVELKDGRSVAVKSVWAGGKDVTACLERGMMKRDCIQLANYKLMKEIALLQQLRHPNVVKLLGFCIKDDGPYEGSGSRTPSTVTIVERGTPITFIDVLQMPWEDRLRVCLGISRLLVYLAESPLGSLAVHDFKLSQFVIVDGEINLADLDDVDDNLPACSSSSDCGLEITTNNTIYTSCHNTVCTNYSQMSNVVQSYLKFFTYLNLEPPRGMGELVGQLINNTKRASWSPRQCLQHMQIILIYYQQGKYMDQLYQFNITDTHYKVYHNQDIVDGEDYWCPGTRKLAASCIRSVHDEHEAIRMCLQDRQCGAFVLSPERTWTGRYLAHFKRGMSRSTKPSKGSTAYVFPS